MQKTFFWFKKRWSCKRKNFLGENWIKKKKCFGSVIMACLPDEVFFFAWKRFFSQRIYFFFSKRMFFFANVFFRLTVNSSSVFTKNSPSWFSQRYTSSFSSVAFETIRTQMPESVLNLNLPQIKKVPTAIWSEFLNKKNMSLLFSLNLGQKKNLVIETKEKTSIKFAFRSSKSVNPRMPPNFQHID